MPSCIDRRNFLKVASTSAANLTILQAGSARTYAANEKLNIACIGAGGRGAPNIRKTESQNIVVPCDVDRERAAEMFEKHPKAKRYKDYRVMLSEMESKIDAVPASTSRSKAVLVENNWSVYLDESSETGPPGWLPTSVLRTLPSS